MHAPHLLIALQYCAKDAEDAFGLVRLLALTRPDFELLLFSSADAPLPPEELVRDLPFPCLKVYSGVTVRGWPMGPNAMWAELVRTLLARDAPFPHTRLVLTAEPDSVPLQHDWAARVAAGHAEADAANKVFSGCIVDNDHINGNLVFDRRRLAEMGGLDLLLSPPKTMAWDAAAGKLLLRRGAANPEILSEWRGELRDSLRFVRRGNRRPAWLHGLRGQRYKDEAAELVCSGLASNHPA